MNPPMDPTAHGVNDYSPPIEQVSDNTSEEFREHDRVLDEILHDRTPYQTHPPEECFFTELDEHLDIMAERKFKSLRSALTSSSGGPSSEPGSARPSSMVAKPPPTATRPPPVTTSEPAKEREVAQGDPGRPQQKKRKERGETSGAPSGPLPDHLVPWHPILKKSINQPICRGDSIREEGVGQGLAEAFLLPSDMGLLQKRSEEVLTEGILSFCGQVVQQVVELSGHAGKALKQKEAAEVAMDQAMKRSDELRGDVAKYKNRANSFQTEKTELEVALERARAEVRAEKGRLDKATQEALEQREAMEQKLAAERTKAYNQGADDAMAQAATETGELLKEVRELSFQQAWIQALKTVGVVPESDLYNQGGNAFELFKNTPLPLATSPATEPAEPIPVDSSEVVPSPPVMDVPPKETVTAVDKDVDLEIVAVTEGPKVAPELPPVKVEKTFPDFTGPLL